jgi:nucleoside-diphosphate-sugar epimerase
MPFRPPLHHVFVTGATGYLGRSLSEALIDRGHAVHGLARPRSNARLFKDVHPVIGDALSAASYVGSVPPADTVVHLVGTPKPDPSKVAEFRAIDLASLDAALIAAHTAGVKHFVYVSVAQPAPVMRAYVEARKLGEIMIHKSGMNATVLRPWYVIGPGRRWPLMFEPLYRVAAYVPSWQDTAQRLGLVTLEQMTAALVHAVEHPALGVRVVEVPTIRSPVPD